jgi:hypothetical protein
MNWTTDKPMVTGWYWYRKNEQGLKVLMSVRTSEGTIQAIWPSGRADQVTDLPGQWSGPVERLDEMV